MYKLLALDLDGTLVLRDGRIDERDRQAIAGLQARGVAVTLVTGRLYSGTRDIARQLGVRVPVACADGAALIDPRSDDELRHIGIVDGAALQLRELIRSRELVVFPLFDDRVVHDERGELFVRYVQSWSPRVEQVERVEEHPCWHSERGLSAVVVVGLDGQVREVAEALRSSADFDVIDFTVAPELGGPDRELGLRALLAHAAGVSKGKAVLEIAAAAGCESREVVAVGDWLNDASMLQVAGRSFAMGHAPESVKRAATDQLEATGKSGGGVAEAIRRVGL